MPVCKQTEHSFVDAMEKHMLLYSLNSKAVVPVVEKKNVLFENTLILILRKP